MGARTTGLSTSIFLKCIVLLDFGISRISFIWKIIVGSSSEHTVVYLSIYSINLEFHCVPLDYSVPFAAANIQIPTFNTTTPVLTYNNWIVIQQRLDGSVSFVRYWADYVAGFGNLTNYWLGLEKMHQLTSSSPYTLRIEIQATSNAKWFYAEYSSFYIDSSSNFYAIHASGYSGDAGDGFTMGLPYTQIDGAFFTTLDVDNDNDKKNCVSSSTGGGGGGWWCNDCYYFDLNDPYGSTYFYYRPLTDLNLATAPQLMASRMMIKLV